MIIAKLISGLGNQLFQYAVARDISLKKNVPLQLDISFFKSQNLRSYTLNNYNIEAEIATEKEVNRFINISTSRTLYYKLYRKGQQLLSKEKTVYEESEWFVYQPSIYNITANTYLNGYWQHYKYFTDLHPAVLAELTVKKTHLHPYQKYISNIEDDANSVAVHIRRGDIVTPNELFSVLPMQYFSNAMALIKQKINNPSFYFFSDDMDWVKMNLHVDNGYYIDTGKDFIDLELMSRCKHNIIANSSFSWWGAFLNKNPGKMVIAPKHWVTKPEVNEKVQIQMPSWIQL